MINIVVIIILLIIKYNYKIITYQCNDFYKVISIQQYTAAYKYIYCKTVVNISGIKFISSKLCTENKFTIFKELKLIADTNGKKFRKKPSKGTFLRNFMKTFQQIYE